MHEEGESRTDVSDVKSEEKIFMSDNIEIFKVKKIENFTIPLKSFFKHKRTDWHPEKEWQEDGSLILCGPEASELSGTVVDGIFHCKDLYCRGEGSETFMDWILEPAFKESSGVLIVSCLYESGDSIEQLRVHDGNIEWVNIEI